MNSLSQFEPAISNISYFDQVPGWFKELMESSKKDALIRPGRVKRNFGKRPETYPEHRPKLPEESKGKQPVLKE